MSDILGDLFKNEKPKSTTKNTNVEDSKVSDSNTQKADSKDFSDLEKLLRGEVSNDENSKQYTSESKFEEKKDFSKIQNAIKDSKDLNVDSLSNADKETIAKYNQVTISKLKNSPILHYEIPVPKANTSEQEIINTIKEAATRIISLAPYKIRDEKQRWNVYYQKVMEIISSSPELKIPETMQTFYAESVVREMVGFGKIDLLLKDDLLEEIMIIGPNVPVYVFHRQYEMMTTNIIFYTDKEIQDIVGRIARYAGRRIDYSQPLLDARLPDGSRVNATLPPASVLGSTLTIRKFREDPYTIIDLINNGTLDTSVAAYLWLCVEGMGIKPANIVISGGTGSGKTTTLNVLSSLIPEFDRVISIEDTAELNLPLKHWIRLEARPPGIEGTGEISLEMLTKNALRMRPDRIIVGEVRGKEAESLFTAMNTGHDGCLTSDTKIAFSDGLESIGDFVDPLLEKNVVKKDGWEITKVKNKYVNSLNSNGKIVKSKVVEARRKKYSGKILKIKLTSGSEIKVTPNHPFYTLNNSIDKINAEYLKEGQFLAAPNVLRTENSFRNKDLEYWSGLLHGDGHIIDKQRIRIKNNKEYLCNDGRLSLYTEDKSIIPDYSDFLKKQFGNVNVVVKKVQGCYEVKVSGINTCKSAQSLFDIPSGSRLNANLSKSHFGSTDFVSGFFDAEGHVDLNNNALVFTNANKHYIDFIFLEKLKKLNVLINSKKVSNTNVDVIPCNLILENLLNIAKAQNISERLIAKKANIPQSSLRAYRLGIRNPSKDQLKKIAKGYDKLGIKNELLTLANADVFWDKILSIKEENYSGFIYDLTISETKQTGTLPHNFVAENIIVGNSLGTLHANSSEETIVRITNPPMNVPKMMLSGLDMIIVQNRLHDRRKGTIRRIVEISEITGVLEDNVRTQKIFEWDPRRDKLIDTSMPSKVLKNISLYSGKSLQQVKDEIENRKQFLSLLVDKNIRDKNEIIKYIEKYYEK